jgi:uncharacterized RDD family membrane protein YckC
MQFYVNREGHRSGPIELADINRQLAAGRLNPSDLGWSEGSPGWKPLLSFAGVIVPGGASSSAIPIAIAKPVIFGSKTYAGFWIRMLAFVVDAILLGLVVATILFLLTYAEGKMSILRVLIPALVCPLYFAAMWSSPMQATLGQTLFRLRVIRVDGGAVSFMRGLWRVLGMVLAAGILAFGYIMIAFDERKRGLHDIIAGTCVVRADR